MQVSPIVDEVRKDGDEAVKRFTEKFDRVKLSKVCVRIEVRRGGPAWATGVVAWQRKGHSTAP